MQFDLLSRISIVLLITSIIIIAFAAIYTKVSINRNFKKALRLKRGYMYWLLHKNRAEMVNEMPSIYDMTTLFKKIYPNSSDPIRKPRYKHNAKYQDNYGSINLVGDFPIYGDEKGNRLILATNRNSIRDDETHLVLNIFDMCFGKFKESCSLDFWICFIICFPGQVINYLDIPFKKSVKTANLFNLIYWTYDVIDICMMIYKLVNYI